MTTPTHATTVLADEILAPVRAALARVDVDLAGPEVTQALLTAGVLLLAHNVDEGSKFAPFTPGSEVGPTEVAIAATAMLDAVEVELFELAMWRTWGVQ